MQLNNRRGLPCRFRQTQRLRLQPGIGLGENPTLRLHVGVMIMLRTRVKLSRRVRGAAHKRLDSFALNPHTCVARLSRDRTLPCGRLSL